MLAWAGISTNSYQAMSLEQLFASPVKPFELCRLLSARLAEKVVTEFYRDLGSEVKDVAKTQLEANEGVWKLGDIIVDGQLVDVKNARRSFSVPNRYSEQFVKSWKRNNDADVTIVGTLSPYVTKDGFLNSAASEETPPDDYEMIGDVSVLGEVSVSKLRNLSLWCDAQFSGALTVDLTGSSTFLPSWVFEYPANYYLEKHANAAELIDRVIGEAPQSLVHLLPKPWALLSAKESVATRVLTTNEELFIWRLLKSDNSKRSLSRPFIFVAILGSVLQGYISEGPKISVDAWRSLLFGGIFEDEFPLGLHDPLGQIAELLDVLDTISRSRTANLKSFQFFKLNGPNILSGQKRSGEWVTLVAFCGGWKSNPTVKCGKTPLVIGKTTNCQQCGKLVCPECKHCSNGCADNQNAVEVAKRVNHSRNV